MLSDLLFTPRCLGCQTIGRHICHTCLTQLSPRQFELPESKLHVWAAGTYEGWLRDAIVRLKTGSRGQVFGLARLLSEQLPDNCRIVSVPTSRQKVKERGFDSMALMCRQITQLRSDITYAPVLRLHRPVRDQVGLSAAERRANLNGAVVSKMLLSGSFVVVDDVVTTGSTVQECARALRLAGAKKVSAISVCASANRG